MKNIIKSTVNSGKELKKEELLNLKGGKAAPTCYCYDANHTVAMVMLGETNQAGCKADCTYAGYNGGRYF